MNTDDLKAKALDFLRCGIAHNYSGDRYSKLIAEVYDPTASIFDELDNSNLRAERAALKSRMDEIERQEPLMLAVFATGRIIDWHFYYPDSDTSEIELTARKYGKEVTKLYTMPPMPAKQDGCTAIIPMCNGIPKIIDGMRHQFIGEFSWKEEAPYYDKHGEIHEHVAQHVVPWDICKDIYKQMALFAIKSVGQSSDFESGNGDNPSLSTWLPVLLNHYEKEANLNKFTPDTSFYMVQKAFNKFKSGE